MDVRSRRPLLGGKNSQEGLSTQEGALLDYARHLNRHRKRRRAVHIHLSKLLADNRRGNYINMAVNTFDSLSKAFEGRVFRLANSDLIFVCKGASVGDIDGAVLKLRYLFSEDPLSHDNGQGPVRFCTWYDMEKAYPAFLRLAEALAAERKAVFRRESASAEARDTEATTQRPLDPARLGRIEETLEGVELTGLIRRQPICALVSDGPPHPIFEEIYISIGDLQRELTPHLNLMSNRWLFQHLTQMLDKRMLTLLGRSVKGIPSAYFSINLNLSSLLTPEFLAFDKARKAGARSTIVVELQKLDIFADMGAYIFARDHLHERGYRICLDGLTHLTAPFIDRERLGLDLLKIAWSPDIVDGPTRAAREDLAAVVKRAGQGRVILSRCDSEEAISQGHSLGISLFQGRYVDGLLGEGDRQDEAAPAVLAAAGAE